MIEAPIIKPQQRAVRLAPTSANGMVRPYGSRGLSRSARRAASYGLFARPDHLGQINQAFMAAPPAAHLKQFAAASNRIGDPGRRLGRPADELPHAPFMAGKRVRRAVGFLDLGRQIAVCSSAARNSRT